MKQQQQSDTAANCQTKQQVASSGSKQQQWNVHSLKQQQVDGTRKGSRNIVHMTWNAHILK